MKTYECSRCGTSVEAIDPDSSVWGEVASLYRDGQPVTAIKLLREHIGSLRDAKFLVEHIAIYTGYCSHCTAELDDGSQLACSKCGAFVLNLPGGDRPSGVAVATPFERVVLVTCPDCGHELGDGVTRCWQPECSFRLTDRTVAVAKL